MKKKVGIIVGGIAAIAAVVAIVIGIIYVTKGSGYRSIKVYQISGSVTLNRAKVGDMDAYENLLLQAEDVLKVGGESHTCLLMDEDKYALVEENTQLTIEATGKGEDTKTNVVLNKGAICFEIQNKLSEKSSFEVTTSNAVMAVRGTAFRVKTGWDAKGKPITWVSVVRGKVSVKNLSTGEEILLEAGEEAVVYTDEEQSKEVIEVTAPVDYSVMPWISVDFFNRNGNLADMNSCGEDYCGDDYDYCGDDSCGDYEGQDLLVTSISEKIAAQYDYAGTFHEGIARVGRIVEEDEYYKKYKYFFIDTEGEVISDEYDWASDFHEGMAAVANYVDGDDYGYLCNNGFINTSGEEVIPLTYKSEVMPSDFFNGYAAIVDRTDSVWVDDVYGFDGYYRYYNQCYLIDKSGNRLPFAETIEVGKGDDEYGVGLSEGRVLSLRENDIPNHTWSSVQNARIESMYYCEENFPVLITDEYAKCGYVVDRNFEVVKTISGIDGYVYRTYEENADGGLSVTEYFYSDGTRTHFLDKNFKEVKVFDYKSVNREGVKYYSAFEANEQNEGITYLLDKEGNEILQVAGSLDVIGDYVRFHRFGDTTYGLMNLDGEVLLDGYSEIRLIGSEDYRTGEISGYRGFICSVGDYNTGYTFYVLDTDLKERFHVETGTYYYAFYAMGYYHDGKYIPNGYYSLSGSDFLAGTFTYDVYNDEGEVVFTAPWDTNYGSSIGSDLLAMTMKGEHTWSNGETETGILVYTVTGELIAELPGVTSLSFFDYIDGKEVFYSYIYDAGKYIYQGYVYEDGKLVQVNLDMPNRTWTYGAQVNPSGEVILDADCHMKIMGDPNTIESVTLYVNDEVVDSSAAISLPVYGIYKTAEALVEAEWYGYEAREYSIHALNGSFHTSTYDIIGSMSEEGMIRFCEDGKWGYLKAEME